MNEASMHECLELEMNAANAPCQEMNISKSSLSSMLTGNNSDWCKIQLGNHKLKRNKAQIIKMEE